MPKPFKAEAGEGVESPLVALQDSAGIVVVPIFGAPPGVAGPLAEIMAAEFRRANVPATTGSAIKNAYLLEGEATFVPQQSAIGTVTVDWTVTDKTGSVIERFTTAQPVAAAAWRAGGPLRLNALAADAVPRIAGLLQSDMQGAPESAPPTIGIVRVEGAPGDGNEALKSAFEAVLKSAGLPVAPEPERAAIQVFGAVSLAPQQGGREQITIEWTLREPDGAEIGVLTQTNVVADGVVDARWGSLAYDVTFAMVDSIADVLQIMDDAEEVRRDYVDDLNR